MSLAETAVEERAESIAPQTVENTLPSPGKYLVESTGAPIQVPLGALITIAIDELKGEAYLTLDDELLGTTLSLPNGDFAVHYLIGKTPARLQFRQTGLNAEYLFGVSMTFPVSLGAGAMDDPPVTGVWGAEARPPRDDDYGAAE